MSKLEELVKEQKFKKCVVKEHDKQLKERRENLKRLEEKNKRIHHELEHLEIKLNTAMWKSEESHKIKPDCKIHKMAWALCATSDDTMVTRVLAGTSLKKAFKSLPRLDNGLFPYNSVWLLFNGVLLAISTWTRYKDIEKDYEKEIAEKHMAK